VAELEDDLRALLLVGIDAAGAKIGPERLERARRIAGWLAANEEALRTRGLLSFGEKLADLHLAPELEEALAREPAP